MFNDGQNIRIPDETRFSQLLEDKRSEYEKNIDEALFISMNEIDVYNTNSNNYEQSIIEEYNNETNKRQSLLAPILFEIQRISNFDEEIKEMYKIIKPIIDSYCNRYIDNYEFDEITYNYIFKNIRSLRISNINIMFLETIFRLQMMGRT